MKSSDVLSVFDRDGTGYVTSEDMHRVMTSINGEADPELIEQIIQESDIDGDGRINFRGKHTDQ